MSSWLSWGSTADEKKTKEQREKQERESRAASRQQRMTGQELENELPVPQPEEEQNLFEALPAARDSHTMAAFETADEANEATMKVPRLRTFDPEDAEGWFCQNEAIMILAGVKAQATKSELSDNITIYQLSESHGLSYHISITTVMICISVSYRLSEKE